MDWKTAFTMQAEFDGRLKEEQGKEGTVEGKCWAFRTEISELSNEFPRVFKWWSKKENNREKGLVEYADAMKFLISLGQSLGVESKDITIMPIKADEAKKLHSNCSFLSHLIEGGIYLKGRDMYMELVSTYIKLGHELGFTPEEMMQAFVDKDKVIHTRIAEGY